MNSFGSLFQKMIVTLLLTMPLAPSCAEDEAEREKNLKNAYKLNLLGQTLHVGYYRFEPDCNQFYFKFMKTRANNSCVAITAETGLATMTFQSADGAIDITAAAEAQTLTIEGTRYNCYKFGGEVYSTKGEKLNRLGPIFLTKSTAISPYDLNGDDVDYIGVENQDVCDAFQ